MNSKERDEHIGNLNAAMHYFAPWPKMRDTISLCIEKLREKQPLLCQCGRRCATCARDTAHREVCFKPRPDLLPADALMQVSELLAWGASRGKDTVSTYTKRDHLAAALRHVLDHLRGRVTDEESGRPALVHAAARILFAVEAKS